MTDQGSARNFNDSAWGGEDADERSSNDGRAPVLSQIHVSCYVTAANRATPVFEVLPQRNSVRVANKPASDTPSGPSPGSGAMTGALGPSAEWGFDAVFTSNSTSHAIDFFTEISLPALRTAREGINSNVVVWGVHPTQKFRLLFGKTVGGGGFAPQPEMAVNDAVELYGQLVGMLHAFFSQLDLGNGNARRLQHPERENWRLGISSWIIVNNQAIDLLKTPAAPMRSVQADQAVTFVTLEASSLATAFRIVQTAKTNRIVRKQNAESVHFFVRLAMFHGGQVSTVHLVDLIDQKDFQDPVLEQEKLEFYNMLQDLKRPVLSPRQSTTRHGVSDCGPASPISSAGNMVLSNFMLPLLTANAKTFLYANVIDSRTSLRESVQMLNAVANLRGFACVCKRLCDVSFEQLGFQANSNEFERQEFSHQNEQDVTPEADEISTTLLNRPVFSAPVGSIHADARSLPIPSSMIEDQFSHGQASIFNNAEPCSTTGTDSDAMSWLNAFAQRKRDILGGSIDSIPQIAGDVLHRRASECIDADTSPFPAFDSRSEMVEPQQHGATLEARSSISDLYERLRESLDEVNEIEPIILATPRMSYSSTHLAVPGASTAHSHVPLPIADHEVDGEIFEAAGYSRTTIDSLTRHEPYQLHQGGDNSPMWTHSNRAGVEPPVNYSASSGREGFDAVSTRPERNLPFSSMPSVASPVPEPLKKQSAPDNITLETFKKAGLSPCLLEPPNLDGLDVKTAHKIQAADATLLRKNYDALLSIVREQQQAKEAAETHAAEALHDQEEQRAMFEVQIENMKLANVGLRGKVRALENRTSMAQVFEQYEQELRSLHAQVQELQGRNVALELRASSSEGSIVIGSSRSSSSDMKKRYQQVVEEKLALEREVMEHRRRERHHQVHSRLAGESTRRVGKLSRDLNNKEEDLVAARLSKQRISAEMNQALEKADQLHHENEKLLQEKASTTEELLAARMYLASLENEKKKASILDRFVEKHGDRMNKLRQHGSSSGKAESWRRDQTTRECEDKLLATVKRSLPQAVPLCNKILRRLEMQELSLREFSEREVDFINLLVELVSDQPTISLKRMIEQEMQKLQT